jgi:NADH-quinone oxidoreductase subunit J
MQILELIKNLSTVQILFYVLSVATLFGGIGTVLSKNPMHSVLYLIFTFFSLSGIYLLLNAQFLAAVNIIVYAGAIMVLFLFVLMFLNLKKESTEFDKNKTMITASIAAGFLGLVLISSLKKAAVPKVNLSEFDSRTGLIETLGTVLYKDYVLPFELVSILFLIAIAGAVLLGKREKGENNF